MRRAFLWIAFILSYDFTNGDKCDDLDEILHTTLSTLKHILNGTNSKVEALSGKFDTISKEVDSQKSSIEDMKRSLEASEKECVELLAVVEVSSLKLLQNQKFTRKVLQIQADSMTEIKNIIVLGFSKIHEELVAVNGLNASLIEISQGIEKLTTEHGQQKTKLSNLHDTIKQVTDSIGRAIHNNTRKIESLLKDVSKSLHEQSKPLSTEALSHVNKIDAIVKSTNSEIKKFDDLEPKLIHVLRLSEDLQNEQSSNPLVNNLTVSLRALKISAPQIVSSVSKNVNELNGALGDLKAMSKDNNCPVDFTSEIRDHHHKMIKYLDDTIAGSKNKEEEIWNDLMRKFENIERSAKENGHTTGKLIKLREDIADIRGLLSEHFGETVTIDDTVFG